MKYTFKYTKYEFKYPKFIDKFEYYRLKTELKNNPKYKFYKSESFIETFKIELIIFFSGAIGILVTTLSPPAWLEFISAIPIFVSFAILFSFIPSCVSYLEFIEDRSKYFSNLRKAIIKSEDYTDFTNNYKI